MMIHKYITYPALHTLYIICYVHVFVCYCCHSRRSDFAFRSQQLFYMFEQVEVITEKIIYSKFVRQIYTLVYNGKKMTPLSAGSIYFTHTQTHTCMHIMYKRSNIQCVPYLFRNDALCCQQEA